MDYRQVTPISIQYIKSASIAIQAKLYLKLIKLHRVACQNVWFNQQCKYHKVIPNYINIRSNTHNRAANIAIQKAQRIWLGEESRRWFTIRDNLKLHLKVLHMELSYNLHNVEFDLLDQKARELASRVVQEKYEIQSRKLQELINKKYAITDSNKYQSSHHSFYPRLKNLSNVIFSNKETSLLEKGLKYSIPQNITVDSLETLAVDAEIAITKNKKDNLVKSLVAHQIKTYKGNHFYNTEFKIFRSIQTKIHENNLVVNKADKGNTIVIMPRIEYNTKIQDIIMTEEFQRLAFDPTKRFLAELKLCIKSCNYLFTPNSYVIKSLIPMNPRCPLLYGLPKIHKDQVPVRPVVSYINAPAYKLSKYLNTSIKENTLFKAKYSIKNSYDLIEKIKDVHLPTNSKLVSLDVKNLFTNVPYNDCLIFIKNMLEKNNLHPEQIDNILRLTELCSKQNYFQFSNEYYLQKDGLAMGSPLSPLMADIFMDYYENKYLVKDSNILYYYRYVDDILLAWTGTIRQLHSFVGKVNSIHPKIKFTLEIEENKSINFLDLSIHRQGHSHTFQIFRKPTYTDTTIPASSCHPWQHKLAAFHSMIHRLLNIPQSQESYLKELNIIYQIARSNGYSKDLIDKLIHKKRNNIIKSLLYPFHKEPNICTSVLTYFGNITDRLTKTLRREGIYSAFKSYRSLKSLCNGKDKTNNNKKSGIYKLACDQCDKIYIGQTGRSFEQRYREHLAAFRNNHPDKSHFAAHLLETGHSLDDSHSFNVLHTSQKGFKLCVLEQLEIIKHNRNRLLNEQTNFITSPLLNLFAHKNNDS